MASPDLYGALLGFLDGDAGDVRTRLNALEGAPLAAGSVTFTRASRGPVAQRGRATKALSIDIVPSDSVGATRPAGIGVQEVDFGVTFEVTVRRKDLAIGKGQLRSLESIQDDLVAMYEGLSSLVITDPAGVAMFVGATARRGPVDRTPANGELQTATVAAVFTFLVPLNSNA